MSAQQLSANREVTIPTTNIMDGKAGKKLFLKGHGPESLGIINCIVVYSQKHHLIYKCSNIQGCLKINFL